MEESLREDMPPAVGAVGAAKVSLRGVSTATGGAMVTEVLVLSSCMEQDEQLNKTVVINW
jgi:hypothetical protein